jgi:hypothetical protein
MTIRKIEKIEKLVSHPLEEFLNIEPASTEIVRYERKTELNKYEEYDEKDTELEETYQEILDAAMTGYDTLKEVAETADTKFLARLAEVQVQHLNVALAAAGKKTQLKQDKDRQKAKALAGSSKTVNTTNILIADRNELLRRLTGEDGSDPIDVDVVPVNPEE